jgi:hypothetical protein
LVVLPVQSVSPAHPQKPPASHTVPSAFLAQSDATAHATHVLVVVLQTVLPSGFLAQSPDVAHWTHVLVVVLQAVLPSGFILQSVEVRHWTHSLVVVSQTPSLHGVVVEHDGTHVFVVVLHTSPVTVQFEVVTHATHLPLEQ